MILVYGAYGYTGKLIVEAIQKAGLPVTVAGRNRQNVKVLAKTTKLPYLSFSLDDPGQLLSVLKPFELVILCAGPFEYTAAPMAQACIDTKTHYIDITGEYQVFEALQKLDEHAKKANIMLLPGAGFDVVPSDCLAARLKDALPDGNKLTLAFTSTAGSLSKGTTKTMIENIDKGQFYRVNGELVAKKMGESVREVDYGDFKQLSVGISWGDISTAYFSTGVPNIEVLTGSTRQQIKQMKWSNFLKPILSRRWVKNILLRQADKKPAGPSLEKRAKSHMYLWGEISNGKTQVEKRMKTPNGYSLTAQTVILIAQKILSGNFVAGYQTPSSAYGKDLIFEIEGCEKLD